MAAALVIIYALVMASGLFDKMSLIICGLFFAAGFWVVAGFLFSTLTEEKGATEGGGNPLSVAMKNFEYLWQDRQLQMFIITRGLLIATALAPPFMVALSVSDNVNGYGGLGWLILASSGAALCSSYICGRLADRTSRKVLIYSALAASIVLFVTVIAAALNLAQIAWVLPVLLFGLMIAYQGVRLGRSTHLVDMADEDKRAAYTALSNTVIGVLLIIGGGFSLLAQNYGEIVVLGLFSLMSFASIWSAYNLKEEQHD